MAVPRRLQPATEVVLATTGYQKHLFTLHLQQSVASGVCHYAICICINLKRRAGALFRPKNKQKRKRPAFFGQKRKIIFTMKYQEQNVLCNQLYFNSVYTYHWSYTREATQNDKRPTYKNVYDIMSPSASAWIVMSTIHIDAECRLWLYMLIKVDWTTRPFMCQLS